MKRLSCFLLALVLLSFCASAFAASDLTLPEKMDKQLSFGNGLKGKFVLHAEGVESLPVTLLPFLDLEFSMRGMKSGEELHYYFYQAGTNEERRGLTELYQKDGNTYFRSDLLPGKVFYLPGLTTVLDGMTGSEGGNPSFASMIVRALQMDANKKESQWVPMVDRYAMKLDAWLEGFRDGTRLQTREGDGSLVELHYTIPMSEIRKEILTLLTELKQDAEACKILEALMDTDQIETYFNPNLDYYYDAAMSALDSEFDVTLSRTITLLGEQISSMLELPLDRNRFGFTGLTLETEGARTAVTLKNDEMVLTLSVSGNLSTASDEPVQIRLLRYPAPDSGSEGTRAAVLAEVTHTSETSTDKEGTDHLTDHWTATVRRDLSELPAEEAERADEFPDFDQVTADVTLHYSSRYSQSSPTTLEIEAALEQEGRKLKMTGIFKTASPWVFSPFSIAGAENLLSQQPNQLIVYAAEWLAAAGEQFVPIEPESTEEPEMTAEPEQTPEPEQKDEPENTEVPEDPTEPESTDVPEEPETTGEPVNTEEPKNTEEPEATEKPANTEEPENTEKPEATEKPTNTEEPETTENPGNTEEPENPSEP